MERTDLSALYGAHYYETYGAWAPGGDPGKEHWQRLAEAIADGIVTEFKPETALDAGCGRGLLVAALRDRGVDAYGIDFSEYAISQVRQDVRTFCWQGTIVDPLPRRYDLVICHEVLEHLPPDEAVRAVEALCAATDDIFFSSTSIVFNEATHINVRPPAYWAGLFARHGFFRDVDFDPLLVSHPTSVRFRRSAAPVHRIVADYERRFWDVIQENIALRVAALDAVAKVEADHGSARHAGDLSPEVAALELTVAEQREHLDALNDRLAFMSDRESDLRTMLLDAQQQLLERDARIVPLQAEITRRDEMIDHIERDSKDRLGLIHRLVADAEQLRAARDELARQHDERGHEADRLRVELANRDRLLAEEQATRTDQRLAEAEARAAAAEARAATLASGEFAVARPPDTPAGAAVSTMAAVNGHAPLSLRRRVGAVVRRQRGVWRIERSVRKLRRFLGR